VVPQEEARPVTTEQQAAQAEREEGALIERHVAPDPAGRGAPYARLTESGAPVWALVAYHQGDAGGDVRLVAEGYGASVEAVRAALAYYRRHRAEIDAWLLLNRAA
jgi:uncharacterized protein (DUF433 family)